MAYNSVGFPPSEILMSRPLWPYLPFYCGVTFFDNAFPPIQNLVSPVLGHCGPCPYLPTQAGQCCITDNNALNATIECQPKKKIPKKVKNSSSKQKCSDDPVTNGRTDTSSQKQIVAQCKCDTPVLASQGLKIPTHILDNGDLHGSLQHFGEVVTAHPEEKFVPVFTSEECHTLLSFALTTLGAQGDTARDYVLPNNPSSRPQINMSLRHVLDDSVLLDIHPLSTSRDFHGNECASASPGSHPSTNNCCAAKKIKYKHHDLKVVEQVSRTTCRDNVELEGVAKSEEVPSNDLHVSSLVGSEENPTLETLSPIASRPVGVTTGEYLPTSKASKKPIYKILKILQLKSQSAEMQRQVKSSRSVSLTEIVNEQSSPMQPRSNNLTPSSVMNRACVVRSNFSETRIPKSSPNHAHTHLSDCCGKKSTDSFSVKRIDFNEITALPSVKADLNVGDDAEKLITEQLIFLSSPPDASNVPPPRIASREVIPITNVSSDIVNYNRKDRRQSKTSQGLAAPPVVNLRHRRWSYPFLHPPISIRTRVKLTKSMSFNSLLSSPLVGKSDYMSSSSSDTVGDVSNTVSPTPPPDPPGCHTTQESIDFAISAPVDLSQQTSISTPQTNTQFCTNDREHKNYVNLPLPAKWAFGYQTSVRRKFKISGLTSRQPKHLNPVIHVHKFPSSCGAISNFPLNIMSQVSRKSATSSKKSVPEKRNIVSDITVKGTFSSAPMSDEEWELGPWSGVEDS